MLFSHGFVMNRSMFDAQVAALAGEFHCIAWDERGFGGTRATGPFSYWDSVDVDDPATIDGYHGMLHVFEHGSDEQRASVFDLVAGMILGDETLAVEGAAHTPDMTHPEQVNTALVEYLRGL